MIPIIGDEEDEPDETFTLSLVPDNIQLEMMDPVQLSLSLTMNVSSWTVQSTLQCLIASAPRNIS